MRPVVRDRFVEFTAPLEGVVPWMYADIKGLVTTGIGNLIDPISHALALPWANPDGDPALESEIRVEWNRVKVSQTAAKLGHRYAQRITTLRLSDAAIQDLVSGKLSQFEAHLIKRFPLWESWPACAQLATLSIAWACGPAFRFPALQAALERGDFMAASLACSISTAGNPGIVPRNARNRVLYRNAERVVSYGLDPDALDWTEFLDITDADTQPAAAGSVEEITLVPHAPRVCACPSCRRTAPE